MRAFLVIAVVASTSFGCRSATQITVEVTADDAVCSPALASGVTVGALEALGTRPFAATTRGCNAGSVGSVVLVPSGGDGDDVAFRVLASLDGSDCAKSFGPKCIEARRALRFIPHEGLMVKVPLRQACEGVRCDDVGSTCRAGVCVSATLDPDACTGAGCGEEALSGGATSDGGTSDATVTDATPPDASDATANDAMIPDSGEDAGTGGPVGISTIAAGGEHSCARLGDGAVACWGHDDLGELGPADAGPDAVSWAPVVVTGLPPVVGIAASAGAAHTCALTGDAGVFCWGDNSQGQLGVTQGAPHPVPVAVPQLPAVIAVSAGEYSTCALTPNRVDVHCWGNWKTGVTAPGTLVSGTVAPVLDVGAGTQNGCEASGDAGALCFGEVGFFGIADDPTAHLVPGTAGATQVAASGYFGCALLQGGGVVCWGTNTDGQLGVAPDPADAGSPLPATAISLPRPAVQVAAGPTFACARLDDGEIACWGRNDVGQCGASGANPSAVPPALVPTITGAVGLASGGNHSCAVTGDGGVVCWGSNAYGQLGYDGIDTGTPVHVPL
jgi:hypothetical protein